MDAAKDKTKFEFMRWNEDFMNQKKMKKALELETQKYDNEEFFPYVHGDLIEQQRMLMNTKLSQELKNHHHEILKRQQNPILSQNLTRFKDQNKLKNRALLSSRGHISSAYASQNNYPLFLKNHSQTFARFLKEEDTEMTMKSALKRYEEKLDMQRKDKEVEAQEFRDQVDHYQ